MKKILINLLKYYYCIMDPETPKKYKRIIIGSIIYFLFPLDMIPDLMGPGGYTDDIAVLIITLAALRKYCKDIHKKRAESLLSGRKEKKRK